jgi:hypothetical protein
MRRVGQLAVLQQSEDVFLHGNNSSETWVEKAAGLRIRAANVTDGAAPKAPKAPWFFRLYWGKADRG